MKDDYEYRIKKLKEELEVAHIVKEQNLEDKYHYILGWKMWDIEVFYINLWWIFCCNFLFVRTNLYQLVFDTSSY